MSKNNHHAWDREYQNPQFLTLGTEPLADVKDFFRTLRRKKKIDMTDWVVLDLGCGNGKNLVYAVEQFCASGIGYDISSTAIDQAKKLSQGLSVDYSVCSIGDPYALPDASVDCILDATSSHCLNNSERQVYLREIYRVVKPGGWMFLRTLCLDGDANAKKLIQDFPGSEPNSYVLPQVGITETVFSEQEIKKMYHQFTMEYSEKKSGYQKWGNQSYKRNYLICWLRK